MIAAEQHASRLVVPSSQRVPATRWSSHSDIAAKALKKLAGPHVPTSLTKLEQAVKRAHRAYDKAETAAREEHRAERPATTGSGCRGQPAGIDGVARSTSKSAVSREFVSRTRENLIDLMSRPLGDLRLAVVMLDGLELKGRCCVVALGIDTDGIKHPLGLWDGSTENATVATTLLSNLTGRGLDVDQGVLVVLDGAKALRKAVNDVFGVHTPVQRCVRHKERDVLDHLPEHQRVPSAAGCADLGARRSRRRPGLAAGARRRACPHRPGRRRVACARAWTKR